MMEELTECCNCGESITHMQVECACGACPKCFDNLMSDISKCEVCSKEAELHKVEYSDDVRFVCQSCIDNYKDIDF